MPRPLSDELAFFAPGLRCALFPDWETLPYDTFSPHQDLISERLAALWRIAIRQGRPMWCSCPLPPRCTGWRRHVSGGLHLPLQAGKQLDEAKFKASSRWLATAMCSQVVSPANTPCAAG